jgi:uncharacterized repeat protein (TIGR01451 family)
MSAVRNNFGFSSSKEKPGPSFLFPGFFSNSASKLRIKNFFLIFILALSGSKAMAWTDVCFNNGLTGWTANTGNGGALWPGCGNPTVTVVGAGTAPNTDGLLPMVPPNGCCGAAVQLYSSMGDPNNEDWAQIEQTDTVPTNGNCCLTFWFAGVFCNHHYLEGDTGAHADTYLEVDVLVGGAIVASLVYNWENNLAQIVQLTNAQVPAEGDGTYCGINGTPNNWGYLPWTQYTINLCQYAGQQVTLRATDYDCDEGGHYGFGYISCVNWESCPTPSYTFNKANNPSGTVTAGQTITYTLTYTNTGAVNISGVVINDTVPAGATYVPNSMTSNPPVYYTSQVGNDLIWNVGTILAGETETLTYQAIAP